MPGRSSPSPFPHIGNVGTNPEDIETPDPGGARLRPARRHHRAVELARGTASRRLAEGRTNLAGIAGIDTRALTRRIRDVRRAHRLICARPRRRVRHSRRCSPERAAWPGLEGMDLADGSHLPADLSLGRDALGAGRGLRQAGRRPPRHVVAIDYGAKRNILRCLAVARLRGDRGAGDATRRGHPARTSPTASSCPTAPAIRRRPAPMRCRSSRTLLDQRRADLRHLPRPSDAGAGARRRAPRRCTSATAAPTIRSRTWPTGKVEITSQNHGFVVRPELAARAASR